MFVTSGRVIISVFLNFVGVQQQVVPLTTTTTQTTLLPMTMTIQPCTICFDTLICCCIVLRGRPGARFQSQWRGLISGSILIGGWLPAWATWLPFSCVFSCSILFNCTIDFCTLFCESV